MIPLTTVTLCKWGNSSAVRIPNQVLKQLGLEEGAKLDVLITPDNNILLQPQNKPEESGEQLRAHLDRLLSKVKPETRHSEVEWGMDEWNESS